MNFEGSSFGSCFGSPQLARWPLLGAVLLRLGVLVDAHAVRHGAVQIRVNVALAGLGQQQLHALVRGVAADFIEIVSCRVGPS